MGDAVRFVFVPGASHGPWCWERVQSALARMGEESLAVDLPIEDEQAGTREYADVVLEAMSGVDEDVVLVGHSLGGLTIPLVAAEREIGRLVFVAGVLPVPGMSLMMQRAREPEMVFPNLGGSLALRYYNAATDDDAAWALGQLRAQAQLPYDEITPLRSWPDVASSWILGTQDNVVNPQWAIRAARERLGIEAIVMEGADHSPFLSRAEELAHLLIAVTRDVAE